MAIMLYCFMAASWTMNMCHGFFLGIGFVHCILHFISTMADLFPFPQ